MTRDLKRLILSLMVWAMGEGMFIYLFPLYMRDLGATPVQIGGVLGIAGMGMAALHVPAGYLADRFGRKPVMLTGWFVGLLGAVAMFLAPSLALFSLALMLYYSTTFVISANNSYITASRGTLSVERAFSLANAAYGVGLIISPTLGGWIASVMGLRAVFGWASLLLVLSCAVGLLLSPQPVEPKKEERRYGRLLANRTFLGLVILIFATILAMYLGIPLAPNYLQEVRSVPVGTIGLLGSANAIGIVVFNTLLGRRHPRWGWIVGQVLVFASALVLWLGTAVPLFVLGYFLRSGIGVAKVLATSQVGRVVDEHEMGLAYAVAETAGAGAVILAPVMAGLLYERQPAWPFIFSALLTAVGIVVTIRYAPRKDRHSQLPPRAA